MRCLVTGAAGFIGSSLSDRLLALGHEVIGVDCFVNYYPRQLKEFNLASARQNSHFKFLELDLCSTEIAPLLEGVDWVFHQAAQAGVRASWGENFLTYVNNNIAATQRLLEGARAALDGSQGGTLKKVVYASSSSVYGDAESYPTTEYALPAPVSPYGVTKLAAEHLMRVYASQFAVPTVSLRYFTVYGPRQRPDMAFRKFIEGGLRGNPITIYGDGEQSRDFTFISDIVEANIAAAEKGKPGAVYNLGGGEQATVNQVLSIIKQQIGSLKVNYSDRQVGDARRTGADCSLASSEIGFAPKVSLAQGIQKECEWVDALIKAVI